MPVRKFRSLQEMEDSLWRGSGVPLWEAIARVWRFAERVTAYRFPPGIYKHLSIEQAQQLRDKWEEANFRAFWGEEECGEDLVTTCCFAL